VQKGEQGFQMLDNEQMGFPRVTARAGERTEFITLASTGCISSSSSSEQIK
jgi:hypothetical protein